LRDCPVIFNFKEVFICWKGDEMNAIILKLKNLHILLFITASIIFATSGCYENGSNKTSDKQIAAFQKDLLNIAFEAATAIPVKPHIKDRSNAQQAVVKACFKLDQPLLASSYIPKIENWRNGLCYANLGFYYAKSGFVEQSELYLELAAQIAQKDHGQEWRNNRINAAIAKTRKKLGQADLSGKINKDLSDSETDSMAAAKAKVDIETSFSEQIKALDSLIEVGDFAVKKYTLEVYAGLFNKYYDDQKIRHEIEEKIKNSWHKIPVFVRVDLLMNMVRFSLEHGDKKHALNLVDETQIMIENHRWPLNTQISFLARLAGLHFQAGDPELAVTQVNAAFALFKSNKVQIVNIYRAETLIPLAEAYNFMRKTDQSLEVYKLAAEESIENPNSRPWAKDLCAICCSMALNAVEPDEHLNKRITQICEELGQPW
jgi:hypothetical protein